ncbi:MAG: LuxR C-terminal-related transcriptional regulator [Anaerolineae bacterium]
MSTPLLATKLYIPPPPPRAISRSRLINRLNEGLHSKLILISAPAGFGKTTLVSAWVAGRPYPTAWLSLDTGDNEPTRFLAYLAAALQTIAPQIGRGVLGALQSPQPPPPETILTTLLNDIAAVPGDFILVLDDYHVIEAQAVDQALTFLVEHLPPQMHLVIATREDPQLPLARLRVRGQLAELRANDLGFTQAEAREFLNQVMGLDIAPEDIAALETRTEGWIAGLQLAALSMQGEKDTADFIKSFTGSHHYVLDYLMEEVLQHQPPRVQVFLLRTSILDRMCGPLCDAVLRDTAATGQETLEYLERANLFVVPLDNERRWYRYHHLFADLLRQRLPLSISTTTEDGASVAELHVRASAWYEENNLPLEAFHHAAAASDIERAERLIQNRAMPLHFRGAVAAILAWLESIPKPVRDAHPSLWVRGATLSLVAGQTSGVEEKLQAAEAALYRTDMNEQTRDLIGQIAAARATLAMTRYDPEGMIPQSRRALEYLRPDDLPFRFTAMWTLGVANQYLGDRAAAAEAFAEALAISQRSGDTFSTMLAVGSLGEVQELDTRLHTAAETYRHALTLIGDYPLPSGCEVHLGLARIYYEWNDLDAAQLHGQQSVQLARLYERVIDRYIVCEVFLARLKLAQGDVAGAAATLARAEQSARQDGFVHRLPGIAAIQVLTLLRQGQIGAAADLGQTYELPLSQARIQLARRDASAALAVLDPLRQQMESKGWADERLKVMVLEAVALQAQGATDSATRVLGDALALAEPGGFIRLFLDEGPPMAHLLTHAAARGIRPDYVGRLLAAFEDEREDGEDSPLPPRAASLVEPLTEREMEILRLIALGLSNHEIGERLFLALSTVKGYNASIFGKLQVQRRTEAVARARELGLL